MRKNDMGIKYSSKQLHTSCDMVQEQTWATLPKEKSVVAVHLLPNTFFDTKWSVQSVPSELPPGNLSKFLLYQPFKLVIGLVRAQNQFSLTQNRAKEPRIVQ